MAFIALRPGKVYMYAWNRMGRKGELCQLEVVAARMDSVQVLYLRDGLRAITSGKALREIPKNWQPPEPRLF